MNDTNSTGQPAALPLAPCSAPCPKCGSQDIHRRHAGKLYPKPLHPITCTLDSVNAIEARHAKELSAKAADEIASLANTLFEGDCLSILDSFPANSVDLILCDLPYGTTQNKWDSVINLPLLWAQYRRILKPNGVVVLTAQGVFTAKLILSNEVWFKYKLVWEKSKPTNFLNAKKQPLRKHEDVVVFYPKNPTYHPQMTQGEAYDKGVRKAQLSGSYGDFAPRRVKSNGERYPTDVVYFKTSESEGEVWHPTQKPVSLARYLVKTYSNPGDLVLDNAFGSGSLLLGAALEGRKFVGIELNEQTELFKSKPIDYVDLARRRLESVVGAVRVVKNPQRKLFN